MGVCLLENRYRLGQAREKNMGRDGANAVGAVIVQGVKMCEGWEERKKKKKS